MHLGAGNQDAHYSRTAAGQRQDSGPEQDNTPEDDSRPAGRGRIQSAPTTRAGIQPGTDRQPTLPQDCGRAAVRLVSPAARGATPLHTRRFHAAVRTVCFLLCCWLGSVGGVVVGAITAVAFHAVEDFPGLVV